MEIENLRVSNNANGKIIPLLKFQISNIKKSKFIKEQETGGLLSQYGIRTSLSKIQILGDILF